jgi:hypothetical protein
VSPGGLRRLVAAALAALAGCVGDHEPGEWGVIRYFAELPGRAPMRMVPPMTDRDGNIYVLHGDHTRPEVIAYVGRKSSRWVRSCDFLVGDVHKGDDRGVHGWVGSSQDRAWYWSGDALVETSGRGGCRMILDRDPVTRASLLFRGVYPWVQDQPSRIRAAALIRTANETAPFHAVIDLDIGQLGGIRAFQPPAATDVSVAGVGAAPARGELYALLSYELAGERVVEGRVSTFEGEILEQTPIPELDDLSTDAVLGYLEGRGGRVAGLLRDGRLVVFGAGASGVYHPAQQGGVEPVGVHARDQRLWLVGLRGDRPVLAEIGADGPGPVEVWEASETAAENLRGQVAVRDEREQPYVFVDWPRRRSAVGAFPFLSPFSPPRHSEGMTGWLVAGPDFENLVEGMTAVGFAPVGISYP